MGRAHLLLVVGWVLGACYDPRSGACGEACLGDATADAAGGDATADAAGGDAVLEWGCADGEREGFYDPAVYPALAACAGAWDMPGVSEVRAPSCGRAAGDDVASVAGCNVSDLCQAGWHVCASAAEVAAGSAMGCDGLGTAAPAFFTQRESGVGGGVCDGVGDNDLFGCGSMGNLVFGCGVLDKTGGNLCVALTDSWECSDSFHEASVVVHSNPGDGGVLCCRD